MSTYLKKTACTLSIYQECVANLDLQAMNQVVWLQEHHQECQHNNMPSCTVVVC